jgi:hypothetical protein
MSAARTIRTYSETAEPDGVDHNSRAGSVVQRRWECAVVSGGTKVIITHAIIGSGGVAAVLLAAVGLIAGAIVLAVSAPGRNPRRHAESERVPVWWDQLG